MKRYIRTKDGKIIDISKLHDIKTEEIKQALLNVLSTIEYVVEYHGYPVIKDADTIEELIEVGDLVKFSCEKIGIRNEIAEVKANDLFISENVGICVRGVMAMQNAITELYTKQGDDYKLVWTKEKRSDLRYATKRT